jgi:uncharacterized protein
MIQQLTKIENSFASQLPFDISTFGPINLVVIQPTSFCNLDCDYCYLPDRHLKNQLSLDLIEPIFKNIFTSPFLGQCVHVCWHAGEPLAAPISFYEEAFKIIEAVSQEYNPNNLPIFHSVQTNGVLINQAWCDLFKKHGIHVGVSIDGPDFLHNAHRKTRKGLDTHEAVMRGISHLQKNDICFNIIAVVTENSLNYPDEMFNFFWENQITDIAFNFEEAEGINTDSSLHQEGIESRYRAFIKRFWDLTAQTNDQFQVREFESICSLIYNDQRLNNTDMNHPFIIVNIDYQGNFSTFDPELLSVDIKPYGNFILGNVLTDSFESVCYTEKFQRIYRDIKAGVDLCRETCQYFGVCGGSACSNKYWENGTFNSAETNACKYRIQMITDLVLDELEKSFAVG